MEKIISLKGEHNGWLPDEKNVIKEGTPSGKFEGIAVWDTHSKKIVGYLRDFDNSSRSKTYAISGRLQSEDDFHSEELQEGRMRIRFHAVDGSKNELIYMASNLGAKEQKGVIRDSNSTLLGYAYMSIVESFNLTWKDEAMRLYFQIVKSN